MDEQLRGLNNLDRVIHSPARLMVVTILSVVESVDFTYLLNETGLTRGNLSTHLSKLEDAGYVEVEKTYRGKIPLSLYRLTNQGREAFEGYRKQLKYVVDGSAAGAGKK